MPPLAALFARTFVIGVAVAAPVGAMGVLCIQRTLERGWRAGTATGFGIATADGIYAGLTAFGVAAVSAVLVTWQAPLRIVGGVVLLWLAWRAISTAPARCAIAERSSETALGGLYASAVGLTLTNPTTIMAFAAVFASAGLGAQPGPAAAAIATAGVASGSLTWWVALSSAIAVGRHAAGERTLMWVNRASGAVIGVFGIAAIATGVVLLGK